MFSQLSFDKRSCNYKGGSQDVTNTEVMSQIRPVKPHHTERDYSFESTYYSFVYIV